MSLTGTGSWAYTFDAGNRLSTTTNPYSEVTTNAFDVANRITSQTNGPYGPPVGAATPASRLEGTATAAGLCTAPERCPSTRRKGALQPLSALLPS